MSSPSEHDGLHVQRIEELHNPDHLPEAFRYKSIQEVTGATDDYFYPNGSSKRRVHPQRRNPFGLNPLAFGALIALITALIVGAAVGGGLGAILAGKEECNTSPSRANSTSSSKTSEVASTTSATTTTFVDYVVPEPSLIQTLNINCPELNNTILQDKADGQYRVGCGRRILGSSETKTFTALIAYSLQDCIQACYLYNVWVGQRNCTAVSWCKAMSYCSETNPGGNCWLFNASSSTSLDGNSTIAILESF